MVESFNPDGRPTKYKNEETDKQVYKFALLGLIDKEMAGLLDITESTFNKWKYDFPTFSESLKNGKEIADADVATKLHERAMGMEWEEECPIKVKVAKDKEEVIIVKVTKKIAPDVGAINSWLTNRKSSKWKNKQDTTISGNPEEPLTIKPDLSKLSDDELTRAIKLASKLPTGNPSGSK